MPPSVAIPASEENKLIIHPLELDRVITPFGPLQSHAPWLLVNHPGIQEDGLKHRRYDQNEPVIIIQLDVEALWHRLGGLVPNYRRSANNGVHHQQRLYYLPPAIHHRLFYEVVVGDKVFHVGGRWKQSSYAHPRVDAMLRSLQNYNTVT